MGKQITSIFFVAGTCVGMGMLVLPVILAKFGIATSLVVMFLIWLLMYYPSLAGLELNLDSERGLSIGLMKMKISREILESAQLDEPRRENFEKMDDCRMFIHSGFVSYLLLFAFIYAMSFFSKKMLEEGLGYSVSIFSIEICWLLLIAAILSLPTRIILQINNLAFLCFLVIFGILSIGMIRVVDFEQIPRFSKVSIKNMIEVIVLATASFGYQSVFHILRNYCRKDANMLRKAFLWGSIISMMVYMFWTSEVLGVIFKNNPEFFKLMTEGKITIEALINELAKASGFLEFRIFFWGMLILALFTSVLGLSIGLTETLSTLLECKILSKIVRRFSKTAQRFIVSLIVLLPLYVSVTNIVRGDFDFAKFLGLAGALLTVIAIVYPIILLDGLSENGHTSKFFLLKLSKWLVFLYIIIGVLIMMALLMYGEMYEKDDTKPVSVRISYVSRINSDFYQT